MDKQALLSSLESRVESHLQEAVRVFQNLDEKTLLLPSPTGGWSIAQCLEHLNSYGHYYLPQLFKSLEKAKTTAGETVYKSTWLGNYFVKMMEPSTGTRKFNAFNDHIPSPQLDAYTVVAEFIHQQEQLLRMLTLSRKADLNGPKIPISIASWIKLKPGDVLRFLIAHNERHIQQAKRNL